MDWEGPDVCQVIVDVGAPNVVDLPDPWNRSTWSGLMCSLNNAENA